MIVVGVVMSRPYMRYTRTGTPTCTFDLQTDLYSTIRVVAWDDLAEHCADLKVGDKAEFDGRFKNREYISRDGIHNTVTEFVLYDESRPKLA